MYLDKNLVMFLCQFLSAITDVEAGMCWVYLARHKRALAFKSRGVEISRMIMRVVYLVHRPTNKQLFLMLTVVTVVIMTCLDRLKEISKRADKAKDFNIVSQFENLHFLGIGRPRRS